MATTGSLDKIHMVGRELLNEHFCKTFVIISAVRWQQMPISTFPIVSQWQLYIAKATSVFIRLEQKTQVFVPLAYRCYM